MRVSKGTATTYFFAMAAKSQLPLTGRPQGAPRTISRAARSAGAAGRAALSELANASELAALPRRHDERCARA